MSVKTKPAVKSGAARKDAPPKPKRLSKLGEWMKAHPHGNGLIIHDMRAVMR